MCNSIWLFLRSMLRHNRWHIVFFSTLIGVSSAQSKPLVFSMSDEERQQAQYQKWVEIQSRQVQTLEIDANTNLLQEQTFVDWQNSWLDLYLDNNYFGEESYIYALLEGFYLEGSGSLLDYLYYDVDFMKRTLLPVMHQTNVAFKATTEKQLDEVIGKLDKLAGDDGNGNPNINVNFQPIQQTLDQLKQSVEDSTDHLLNISNAITPDIQSGVDDIATLAEKIEQNQIDNIVEVNRNFNESNEILLHIDNDLHSLKSDGIAIDWESGGGSDYLDQTIGKHFDDLAQEIELIADEKTQPTKLGDEYMNEAYSQEQSVNYVINSIVGSKDQLESELSQIQYTNINAKVYDYDEYNNYYTLDNAVADPPSNDQYIREKVQEYIDQVTYTTENVKGQITSRLDDLKSSTLLTTDYDPEWLVVKKGALSQKWDFPKNDWVVDFSEIKLESNITKTVYDWIYYVLAIVVIYKQFSKVV